MTLRPSLRMSSWPGLSISGLSEGCRLTFTLRPWERMVTVLSSLAARYTPYVEGGAQSLSNSFIAHPFSLDPLCAARAHALLVCSKYRRLQKRKSRLAGNLPPVDTLN